MVEEPFVDREEAAGHGGREDGGGRVQRPLGCRDGVPREDQVPVEASNCCHPPTWTAELISERVRIDGVDDRADHIGRVLGDPVEERLEPTLSDLAVRVKKCQHLPDCLSGSK